MALCCSIYHYDLLRNTGRGRGVSSRCRNLDYDFDNTVLVGKIMISVTKKKKNYLVK